MKVAAIAAAVVCLLAASAGSQAIPGTYVNFDAPGAQVTNPSGSSSVGTVVLDMNNLGQVIGLYTNDSSIGIRGFIRDAAGNISLIDAPSAGTPIIHGIKSLAETRPAAINDDGVVVGTGHNTIGMPKAFVRFSDGTTGELPFTGYSTMATALTKHQAGGSFSDGNHWTAFIRNQDGSIITFNAPDANSTQSYMGTFVTSINVPGAAVGWYYDSNQNTHAYVRSLDGVITEFSAPQAGHTGNTGTFPVRIFDSGAILGYWLDDNFNSGSFIRLPNGSFLPVALPQGSSYTAVFIADIDWWGHFIGVFNDAKGVAHSFYQAAGGRVTIFTDPAAGNVQGQGTVAVRMNQLGDVTGNYIDSGNISHGFVWKPLVQTARAH